MGRPPRGQLELINYESVALFGGGELLGPLQLQVRRGVS